MMSWLGLNEPERFIHLFEGNMNDQAEIGCLTCANVRLNALPDIADAQMKILSHWRFSAERKMIWRCN
jgi:hypothetical protein